MKFKKKHDAENTRKELKIKTRKHPESANLHQIAIVNSVESLFHVEIIPGTGSQVSVGLPNLVKIS